MIRHPLGLRLDVNQPVREQIYEAARLGARGVVIPAAAELAPHRLSNTGRREIRHLLHSVELALVGLSLPTRRAFDTPEQLDDRIRRADAVFAMGYELGTRIVLARLGPVPAEEQSARREAFTTALGDLGARAEHRGVRLAVETGGEPPEPLGALLGSMKLASLGASIEPGAALQTGIDPVQAVRALSDWVIHAYASDAVHSGVSAAPNPRGSGFPPGALDWEEYLGALEEIGYGGFVTVWPAAEHGAAAQFAAIVRRLAQIH